MSHLNKDIKDEKEGHEKYEHLARKEPKHRKTFLKMARDEKRHEHNLERFERNEAKTKALRKHMK